MQIKVLTPEQHKFHLFLCNKGKHQFRENSFGVIFCIRCGLLSTSTNNVQKLEHIYQIK